MMPSFGRLAPLKAIRIVLSLRYPNRNPLSLRKSKVIDVTAMTMGVIGLGQMGSGIAANLVRAGFDVLGYDLRAAAVDRLVEAGGERRTRG